MARLNCILQLKIEVEQVCRLDSTKPLDGMVIWFVFSYIDVNETITYAYVVLYSSAPSMIL